MSSSPLLTAEMSDKKKRGLIAPFGVIPRRVNEILD